jgi:putative SOS response-associated peptidase YedK
MFVIFQSNQYDEWLHCSVKEAPGFFTRYPAENLERCSSQRKG